MTPTHCPQCDLRFTHRNEMSWHLRMDHPRARAASPSAPDPLTAGARAEPARRAIRSTAVVLR